MICDNSDEVIDEEIQNDANVININFEETQNYEDNYAHNAPFIGIFSA